MTHRSMAGVLEARGVRKAFGPVVALERLDLDIRAGEVLGLVGQNGSGKSTLLKILAGLVQPDEGSLILDGTPIQLRSAAAAGALGIGMVHQEQSLLPNLTVAENIFLDKSHPSKRGGIYRWAALEAAARAQLAKINIDLPPRALVEDLRFAERQQVELAKVLAIEDMVDRPPVILFDEPTSVLTPDEIALLFGQINRLRQRAAIVFVSHRLEEILSISDRVVVMTDGRKVAERPARDMDRTELYELLVGQQRAQQTATRPPASPAARPVLRVENLTSGQRVRNATFDLWPGEIIGIAGVLGSGAEELCRTLFGAEPVDGGTVVLDGTALACSNPRGTIRRGVGYLPANRRLEGMLKGRSLTENMVVTFGLDYGGGTLVRRRAEREVATMWMSRLKVKCRSPDARIESLSGGNQQKVILGKWLMGRNLKALLLDHPSRGLDPGARDDLFEAIRAAAANGLAVIFIGDTVAEILELSNRVLVMRDGAITARFDLDAGQHPHEEEIVAAMI